MVSPALPPVSSDKPLVGVLALQGDYAAHAAMMARCGAATAEVRASRDLQGLDALVLPGGESTAMLRLMDEALWQGLHSKISAGLPVLATCAGTILLADCVINPAQRSLKLLHVTVERNGFGRQRDSFITTQLDWSGIVTASTAQGLPLQNQEGVFIRAPRIVSHAPSVKVLARWRGEPVLVQEGTIVAATFHPELSHGPSPLHRWFLGQLRTGEDAVEQVAMGAKLCSDSIHASGN